MTALVFVALVLLSTLHEFFGIAWHYAREAGNTGRMLGIGTAMNVAGAVPLVVAIEQGTWYPLAAGIVGSAIGTIIGMNHAPATR